MTLYQQYFNHFALYASHAPIDDIRVDYRATISTASVEHLSKVWVRAKLEAYAVAMTALKSREITNDSV